MIQMDTDQLQSMMQVLKSTTERIDSAAQMLMSVTTHNEWGCKERYRINDFVMRNRSEMLRLQTDCSHFCAVAAQVANDFVETEKDISLMCEQVESALAVAVSMPVKQLWLVKGEINWNLLRQLPPPGPKIGMYEVWRRRLGIEFPFTHVLGPGGILKTVQEITSPPRIALLEDIKLTKTE